MSSDSDIGRRKVSLFYETHDGDKVERVFEGLTEDDLVFTIAALVGRRFRTTHHDGDMEELAGARNQQMEGYAAQMLRDLDSGLGWWRKLLPTRVYRRIMRAQMSLLRDITTTWTGELIGMHAEANRSRRPFPVQRPRSAPKNGPGILCAGFPGSSCTAEMRLGQPLPKGWAMDDDGRPHCPEHPVSAPPRGKAA